MQMTLTSREFSKKLLLKVVLIASVALSFNSLSATPTLVTTGSGAFALHNDGQLFAWGDDGAGQLGIGRKLSNPVPSKVVGLSGVLSVAAGTTHILAAKMDGSLWAWGYNGSGELGVNTGEAYRTSPIQVGISNVSKVSAGQQYSLALKSDGMVWSWGAGSWGQLGRGRLEQSRLAPLQIDGLSGIQAISAGTMHAMALGADGSVWTWGYNAFGQLGTETTEQQYGQKYSTRPLKIAGLNSVVAIAAGYSTSVALKNDGTVWGWGILPGSYGVGAGPTKMPFPTGMTSVAVSEAGTTFAVGADGVVWQYGSLNSKRCIDQPCVVAGLSDIAALTFGRFFGMGIKRDGTVWGVGWNDSGAIGQAEPTGSHTFFDPIKVNGLSNIVGISTGMNFSAALAVDGAVWTWGGNGTGQLGDGSAIVRPVPVKLPEPTNAVAVASYQNTTVAIKSDGTAWTWGGTTQSSVASRVAGLPAASAASVGQFIQFVRATDGTVWGWGSNLRGQLGQGDNNYYSVPVQVKGLSGKINAISTGDGHTMALRADGTVWSWGSNLYGQIGDGSTVDCHSPPVADGTLLGCHSTPTQAVGLTGVQAVAAGTYHSVALRSDGSVWTWGANMVGELGMPPQNPNTVPNPIPTKIVGISNAQAIAAGQAQTMILKADGTVWRVGNGVSSPTQVTGLPSAIAISTSGAVAADGSVWTWGSNYVGQCGDGTLAFRSTPTRVLNETATGFISLTGAILDNSLDPFKILQVVNKTSTDLNSKLTDLRLGGFNGSVYFTALVPKGSAVVQQSNSFAAGGTESVCFTGGRTGAKQGPQTPCTPVASGAGVITTGNNFAAYTGASVDPLQGTNAIICMGITLPELSAKGQVLVRAIATGDTPTGVAQCPTVQTEATTRLYRANATGGISNLTMDAVVTPQPEDRGQVRKIYSWAIAPDGRQLMQSETQGWVLMQETMDPAWTLTVPAQGDVTLPIVRGANLSGIAGTLVYVGMGSSWEEVKQLNKAGHYYTIE